MADDQWYYSKNGQQLGPISRPQLRELARQGEVSPQDLVWTPGLFDWQPAQTVLGSLGPASAQAPAQTVAPDMPSPISTPYPPATLTYQTPASFFQQIPYASFWLRFCALIVDSLVLAIPRMVLNLILVAGRAHNDPNYAVNMLFLQVVNFIVNWLYYALMESSASQATLGKMAVGIRVTDYEGNRISFGKASGRYFAKIISALILGIGYLMVIWTERKQALHDIMAGTLVVKKSVSTYPR